MSILNFLWQRLNPTPPAPKPPIRCMRLSRRLKTLVMRERAQPPLAGPIPTRRAARLAGPRVRP